MRFRIKASPFGYPMYATTIEPGWTDQASEATVYDNEQGDNPDMKLKYWSAHLVASGIDNGNASIESMS